MESMTNIIKLNGLSDERISSCHMLRCRRQWFI